MVEVSSSSVWGFAATGGMRRCWEGKAGRPSPGRHSPEPLNSLVDLGPGPRLGVLDRRLEALEGVACPGSDEGSPMTRKEWRSQFVEHVLDLF